MYGPLAARRAAGLNPKVNDPLLINASKLSSPNLGVQNALSSPFTWANVAYTLGIDTVDLYRGVYSIPEYQAATTFDVSNVLISSAVGGAIYGGSVGTLMAGPLGTGGGAFVGTIVSVLATMGAYYGLNTQRDSAMDVLTPIFEITNSVQTDIYSTYPWVVIETP